MRDFKRLFSNFRYYYRNPWLLFTFGLVLVLMLPLFVVFSHIFIPADQTWSHILTHLLHSYVSNTLLLLLLVAVLTFVIGVNTAWLVSMYDFPGRRFFSWALILPLSIPAYISGFAYAGMLDYTSPLYVFLRRQFGLETGQYLFFDLLSLPGAAFIFSLSLYPYVYLISRTYFQHQAVVLLEAGASLGLTRFQVYRKVAIPLARPAIAAGISLVLMEVLNDYGLVKYFGVDTFTTGIFTAWFAFGSIEAALKLSVYLMIFVLALLGLERFQRRNYRFSSAAGTHRPSKPRKPGSGSAWLFTLLCGLVFGLGFLFPFGAFVYWTVLVYDIISPDFFQLLANSFQLAFGSALIVLVLAVFLAFVVRTYPFGGPRILVRVATLGYAIPGAVVAIGLLVTFLWLDHQFQATGLVAKPLLTGSYFALFYAYAVRFLAVGYNSIESGNARISTKLDQAARSLGLSKMSTLFRLNLPLLKSAAVAAALLIFIDVMKELPLTLILRPFNFDTLAIRAFEYATDERVAEASPAALVIILAGIIPVILLNRLIGRKGD